MWEYDVEVWSSAGLTGQGHGSVSNFLVRRDEEGWLLVSTATVNPGYVNGEIAYFFRRAKSSHPRF